MVDDYLQQAVHWVTRGIEVIGVLVIVVGTLVALYRLGFGVKGQEDRIEAVRSGLGRSILLGLEFLVAADIISTVAIEPTLESVMVLGAIVLIRTFLSFSLEVEIEGRWPWQQARGKTGSPPAS